MAPKKWKRWGTGPALLTLLVLAAVLALAAAIAYLMNTDSVPTHPEQNGSIMEVEPGAVAVIVEMADALAEARTCPACASPNGSVLPA